MRIKLESGLPLPVIKAWYSVQSLSHVHDLKSALCSDLPPFRHDHIEQQNIILLLDGYQLLDTSPIDVLRDGDTVVIRPNAAPPSLKRRASEEAHNTKKRSKLTHEVSVTRSSKAPQQRVQNSTGSSKSKPAQRSDSDSSEESDSSSSSESDSDSDSDDSSSSSSSKTSSSSSSSDDEHPAEKSAKAEVQSTSSSQRKINASTAPISNVPPGLGKPSTHSRNVRRRRKKIFDRMALTAEPQSANLVPLGSRGADTAPPQSTPQTPVEEPPQASSSNATSSSVFMMSSLQNKNKKKGFKSSAPALPPKIVFSTENSPTIASAPAQASGRHANPENSSSLPLEELIETRKVNYPRLVAPSEKQKQGLLPANMFVTSIDVEEGMHNTKRKKRKQAQSYDDSSFAHEGNATQYQLDGEEGAAIELNYGSVTDIIDVAPELNHSVIEARWESFKRITEPSQVSCAAQVAWKALAINPATFTPEMMLHQGRVKSCDDQLVLEVPQELGAIELSFGGPIEVEGDGLQSLEEIFEWKDVLQGDFRVIEVSK